jgi:UDP-N-acetylmuramoyl-tripeptide--D-alanyl-D-alanine ligase
LFVECEQKITTDTRKLEKGSIFFALKGENFDANTFAQKAIEEGCAYAIVDNDEVANGTTILLVNDVLVALQELSQYHRKQLKFPIIGITGSNAKTTNKELMCAVLSKKYNAYATKGNLNNHIGVPLTLLALTHQHEIAIIEMGANHQGEIALLSALCDPDFGIITNIGRAHLEGFGGEEGIKKGKGELYNHIKNKKGKIFINGNDPVLLEMSNGNDCIFFGENKQFHIYGKLFENSEYVEFKWARQGCEIEDQPLVKTKMFGQYNFINLLCAVCVGNYFGVSEADINSALQNYIPEMNRSQVKKTTYNTLILDAYNANPSSMGLAIGNFIKQPFEKKFFILGDMLELGEYSYTEHKKILDDLTNNNQKNIILVGDFFYKLKELFSQFDFFKTSEEAIEFLKDQELRGFTVLIKGSRGIKLEKLVSFL